MADIFVSYTSSDREWAFWIGNELEALGHTPHVHEWEIKGSEDIYSWMQRRIEAADHMLCVTSQEYLSAAYSTHERNAALWKSAKNPEFALIAVVGSCQIPVLFAHLKHYELYTVDEDKARARLAAMFAVGKPSDRLSFPGSNDPNAIVARGRVPFPSTPVSPHQTMSNIPIAVPFHFVGRDDDLGAIDKALKGGQGRAAVTALHGLRGVGKTALAAAYAERYRNNYRATWWIRAEAESTMRADLVGLGVRFGWVAPDEKEEPALAAVLQRLKNGSSDILLVYDNANNVGEIRQYLPRGGGTQVIVTSNAPDWRGVAAPVQIEVWPKKVGADYLIIRTGLENELEAALSLSEALGGLPLAHEQAAAYCERLGISFVDYLRRFEAAPVKLLDTEKDAPVEYYNRRTVARTFALAIDEAALLNPAAEPLIVYSALLAPEPIPLFLFIDARKKFGEPLASAFTDEGLDEVVATLRAFALIDREVIADERDPSLTTECIRLHRLVRQVAATRCEGKALEEMRRTLFDALVQVTPGNVWRDPQTWPRARRLEALALGLVNASTALPNGAEAAANNLLTFVGQYKQNALAAYTQARPLFERALAIAEETFGAEHPITAKNLNSLATLLEDAGARTAAQPLLERALLINEKAFGPEDPITATALNNLALVLQHQGKLAAARPLFERALAIKEKVIGNHPDTALGLNNLALLLQRQGNLVEARSLLERAVAIYEKILGPEHPGTAMSLNGLAFVLHRQGDFAAARPLLKRALAICEKAFGPEHPLTARSLCNLARLLQIEGKPKEAGPLYGRALAIQEKVLGIKHPDTKLTRKTLQKIERSPLKHWSKPILIAFAMATSLWFLWKAAGWFR